MLLMRRKRISGIKKLNFEWQCWQMLLVGSLRMETRPGVCEVEHLEQVGVNVDGSMSVTLQLVRSRKPARTAFAWMRSRR